MLILKKAKNVELAFFVNSKYLRDLKKTNADCVLLDKKSAIPDIIGTRIASKKKTNEVTNCIRAVFLKLNPINSI